MAKRKTRRVVKDNTPTHYRVMLAMVSASTGEQVGPGQIVTVDGYLAPCSPADINLLLQRGAIVPVEAEEDSNNG